MDFVHRYDSPLGAITVAADGKAVTGVWFEGQRYFADTLGREFEERDLPVFDRTDRWLDLYFGGRAPDFTPPLAMRGTPFRRMVWEVLLTIPYGRTMTYGEVGMRVAERTGSPRMLARAVGGAVAHNPISLIVPCHRVIGADGSLTGYAGGIGRKEKLLALERGTAPARRACGSALKGQEAG